MALNPAGVEGSVGVWETDSTPESVLSLFWNSGGAGRQIPNPNPAAEEEGGWEWEEEEGAWPTASSLRLLGLMGTVNVRLAWKVGRIPEECLSLSRCPVPGGAPLWWCNPGAPSDLGVLALTCLCLAPPATL